MRAFTIACLFAAVVALGAAAILETFVQEPAAAAFAESTARV
jgi:hypothetical protein